MISSRRFSISLNRYRSNFVTQLDAFQAKKGQVEIRFPFISDPNKNLIKVSKTQSFAELASLIPGTEEIKFFDNDGNCLSSGEIIQDWDMFPVIMKRGELDTYIVNFNPVFRIEPNQ